MRKFLIGAFGVVALAASAVAQQGQQVYACKVIDTEWNEQYICYVRQSYDPNEMAGPAGVGAQRFVKPGDPMDYTIYFENQTNATAAAIKIAVTLLKDANLDWSTLELGEVVFGDHTDDGFVKDKSARSIVYALAGSDCEVRTTVTEDDDSVTWNLRIWDPNTTDHFPDDFNKGVLPPNDPETHCGEGHISFRVKVKDDAATGSKINASASIVFDDNPAIITDPAWWNTVGSQGAAFAESEVEANEGESVEVRVNGGNADAAASVKVYLTYNTAAAADIDLTKGEIDGETPKGGLKFPLTLNWAKDEVGEKVITIPVKVDKTVEGDEFFTLQLATPNGLTLGDATVCTVTIVDQNDKTIKASVTPYKPKKDETVATNSVTVASGDAKGGFVAGTGEYTSGSKLTLTAESRPGWAFKGWRLKDGDETILSDKAKWQVVVTNDEDYVAMFEKIPYVRGLADPADGGKVAGSGLCATGKKVTLKATTNKNFTFLGWRQGTGNGELGRGNGFVATTASLVIDRTAKPAANSKTSTTITNVAEDVTYYAVFKSDPEVFVTVDATDGTGAEPTGKGAGKYVAGTITGMGKYAVGKTKIALKATANKGYVFSGWYDAYGELLTKDAAYTIAAMGEDDVEYTAKFITAAEDKASIALALTMAAEAEALGLSTNEIASITNFCGVVMNWQLAANALSATTIKVAGLPSGLKFTAKDIMKKGSKTEVDIPANTIYGAPTAASKTDRSGNVTPSKVVFTVTTAGKSTQTFAINLYIDPLPAWAVGTFDGSVSEVGEPVGIVQAFTIAANGKISGKVLGSGLTWSLAATSFSAVEGPLSDVDNIVFYATVIGKAGKEIVTNEVAVTSAVVDDIKVGVASSDDWITYQNLWKRADTKADMPIFKKNLDRTLELGEAGDANNTVKLTFKKDGVVSFAGKVGGASVSGSSQLVNDGDGWKVTLYAPPKPTAKPPFEGFCETCAVTLVIDDQGVVTEVVFRFCSVEDLHRPRWWFSVSA